MNKRLVPYTTHSQRLKISLQMFTTSLREKNQMRHKDATVTRSQLVAEGKARSGLMCHSVEKESYW